MVSLVRTFECALKTLSGGGVDGHLILVFAFNHSVRYSAVPPPPSKCQKSGRVEGVGGLVAAAAAAPMGLGTRLRGG